VGDSRRTTPRRYAGLRRARFLRSVILQGFKEYFALGFFQRALLKDPKKVLVQLGQVQARRVMKFTSYEE
jgi:uncharacterized protein YdeI (YjbR/CyaY-like superfamily)